MDWIAENVTLLQLGLTALSAVVWLAYLQLLYLSFTRQRQAVVMIHHGAAEDDRARCIITNMGTEPVYVIAILARLEVAGKNHHASVIDREELEFEDLDNPLKRTSQGPLKSGEYMDVGSFGDIIFRACRRLGLEETPQVDAVEITVGAASGHASNLVVANRTFRRRADSAGNVRFVPTTLLTKQVRGSWYRRKLLKRLNYDDAA